jgi:hypothetical protein
VLPPPTLAARVSACQGKVASLTASTATTAERAALANLCRLAGSGQQAQLHAAEVATCLIVVKDSTAGMSAAQVALQERGCYGGA